MKKGVIIILLAVLLMTGCGDTPYSRIEPRKMTAEPESVQVSGDSETVQEAAVGREYAVVQKSVTGRDSETETAQEPETGRESAAASAHVCHMDSGSTVTVLAFGEHEPDCFYGAKYNVKCRDCGNILDTIYREPLGHTGNEGEVTCQPDCTGGGSIRYICVRCGAEWSEAYGQVQPHTWVEGNRKETDWSNGGTKEVPYLYCSVCGQREEGE